MLWITGLKNHPESWHERFNKYFVLQGTKFILQNNNMKFNKKFFNQIKGTAMDTIFAPTFAILSMRCFEIKLYSTCIFKHAEPLAEYIKKNWNHFCMTAIHF